MWMSSVKGDLKDQMEAEMQIALPATTKSCSFKLISFGNFQLIGFEMSCFCSQMCKKERLVAMVAIHHQDGRQPANCFF